MDGMITVFHDLINRSSYNDEITWYM